MLVAGEVALLSQTMRDVKRSAYEREKAREVAPPWETPIRARMGVGTARISRILAMSEASSMRLQGVVGIDDCDSRQLRRASGGGRGGHVPYRDLVDRT